jgi:signal transduction histidine kinase
VRWEAVRKELPGWAVNAVIIFLAIAPLPGQLATGHYQVSYLLSALFFLLLLARRRFPPLIIVAIAGRAILLAFPPYGSSSLAVFGQVLLMFVIAGAARPDWVAWAGWAAGLAMIAVREITGQPRADYGWGDFLLTAAVCSVLFVATLLVTRRTRAHQQMADRAKRAEAERERSAAEAVAAERTRITREMHDVVAHSLTVAVIQCVAAADDLETGSDDLAAISRRVHAAETACRDALDELRRMLGVLRFGTEPLAPTPRLTELTDLARDISSAGIKVELELVGDLDGLPPGIELSCYRIVQEALTNALKHSGAHAAHVSIHASPSDVRVRVTDDGDGTGLNGHGSGQGLIGMRERAAAYGGTLSAGPQSSGGYLVQAVLPRGDRR